MDIEDRRWRWYFDGLSPETRAHMYALSEDEWQAWLLRATVLIFKRQIKGIENTFTPPLALWERECFVAILALAAETIDDEAPIN